MLFLNILADYDLTGQLVWPASTTLAYYLIKNKELLSEQTLLELGSGTGLTGLIASLYSKHITLTDHNNVVLDLLNENSKSASFEIKSDNSKWITKSTANNMRIVKLDWGNEDDINQFTRNSFKIIIGSDIIYWYDAINPLLETVDALLSYDSDSMFILAYKTRAKNSEDHFYKSASQKFTIQEIPKETFLPEELINNSELKETHLLLLKRIFNK